jgi:hypothetical protein
MCGNFIWPAWQEIEVTVREVTERVHIPKGVCKVEGCCRHVYKKNKSGFCRKCGHALYDWKRSDPSANVIQPIIELPDGRWVKNPASLSWRRHEDGYTSQRAVGGRRPCTRCGQIRFIRKKGMCWKCNHAVRFPAACSQCGDKALLSPQGICSECAAVNLVRNWLAAGKRDKFLSKWTDETEPERFERLLPTARKRVRQLQKGMKAP